jgi:type IV secretory pathway TraG/TraD family ATPase VirD4
MRAHRDRSRYFLHLLVVNGLGRYQEGHAQFHTFASPFIAAFVSVQDFSIVPAVIARISWPWVPETRNLSWLEFQPKLQASKIGGHQPLAAWQVSFRLYNFNLFSSRVFTSGHSESITLKYTVWRIRPLDVII